MTAPATSVDPDLCTQVARLTDAMKYLNTLPVKAAKNIAAAVAPTISGADVVGGIIYGTPTAALGNAVVTLPSAASILAALPSTAAQGVGAEVVLRIENLQTATYTITLAVDGGGTITAMIPSALLTVGVSTARDFRIVFTSVTTGSVAASIY